MNDTEADLGITVRHATPDELDAVVEVHLAARADTGLFPDDSAADAEVRDQLVHWYRQRDVWVAESGGLIGLAAIDGDWLDSLYVLPTEQGRGIGAMLLEVVKASHPAGFGLAVVSANSRARTFYRKHGLIELEERAGAADDAGTETVLAWLGTDPIAHLRRQIDRVDAALAPLLARRMALTAAVQDRKPVGGRAGRDQAREQQIATRMARLAPGVDPGRIARMMASVIEESLDAWEDRSRIRRSGRGGSRDRRV